MKWIRPATRVPRFRLAYRPIFDCLEARDLLSAGYLQTNLVSDIPGLAAVTDPHLINPWGNSFGPKGSFWFSDAGGGASTVYDNNTQSVPMVVTIAAVPGSGFQFGDPTGTVFTSGSGFAVSENGVGGASLFLFATGQGAIVGWSPTVDFKNAVLAVDNSATPGTGFVYTGLAIASNTQGTFLYAANFRSGAVDVFDADFHAVHRDGAFTDSNLPVGFAPFGIHAIGDLLYVTYTSRVAQRYDVDLGPGNGYVDVFDTNGALVQRLVSGGPLNVPWGVALAPANFGDFSNALLVGNFEDGQINAFDVQTGAWLGTLSDGTGQPVVIPGMWDLSFQASGDPGQPAALFVTAGIGHEQHGLFAKLQPISALAAAAGASPDLHGAALVAFLKGLPGNPAAQQTDDYPLPPPGGPAPRGDASPPVRPASVLLAGGNAALVLVPTLLGQQGAGGSTATPDTSSATNLALLDRAFALPAPQSQLTHISVGMLDQVFTLETAASGLRRTTPTSLDSLESAANNRLPSAEDGRAAEVLKPSALDVAAKPPPRSSLAGQPDAEAEQPPVQTASFVPLPGVPGGANDGVWPLPHLLLAALVALGLAFPWTRRHLHRKAVVLTQLWSRVTRRVGKSTADAAKPASSVDLPATQVISS
jgi:uncharacterized protein (TIGR03118 family)